MGVKWENCAAEYALCGRWNGPGLDGRGRVWSGPSSILGAERPVMAAHPQGHVRGPGGWK